MRSSSPHSHGALRPRDVNTLHHCGQRSADKHARASSDAIADHAELAHLLAVDPPSDSLLDRLARMGHLSPEAAMAEIDDLGRCERTIQALVAEARAEIQQKKPDRASRECEVNQVYAAPPAYWAEVVGTLRLVRARPELKSTELLRLPPFARVKVVETKLMADGCWRAAILHPAGEGKVLNGWMTLVGKDGVLNLSALRPTPSDDAILPCAARLPSPRATTTARNRGTLKAGR